MNKGKIAGVLVSACLLAGLVGTLAIAEPIPARVGARFEARAHVAKHGWDDPWHTASGKVYLVNKAERSRRVDCSVAIQFQDKDGSARVIAWDELNNVHVGPNTKRPVDYMVQLKDKKHRYGNVPVRANAHCRVVR